MLFLDDKVAVLARFVSLHNAANILAEMAAWYFQLQDEIRLL